MARRARFRRTPGDQGHPSHPLGTGTSRSGRQDGRLPHGGRSREGRSRQDRWADDWAWTVSWMSMNLIDQYPGRGSGSSCRGQKNPANVTATAASQMNTPTARTHGVDPNDITMRPATATASPTYPTRRAQTAILQCPLYCSSGGSSMPGIVPPLRDQGHWSSWSVRGLPIDGADHPGMPDTTWRRVSPSCRLATVNKRHRAGGRGYPGSGRVAYYHVLWVPRT